MVERSLLWSVVQQGGRQVVSYVPFVLLAIMLPPVDFGVVAIAATWLASIQVFAELGFSAALIQRADLRPTHFSSTFYANVALGLILTACGTLLARPVAAFFQTPSVAPIIAVLSMNLLINSLGLTHLAIMQRELRFRDLAIRDIAAALSGGVAGILLALNGFGVWSLVVQSLVTNVGGLLLAWKVTPWRPRFDEVSRQGVTDLWSYSSSILSFNIFKYFAQNTDKLLVGYLLGPLPLGLYSVAWRFVLVPVSVLAGAVGSYLFPRIARAQTSVADVVAIYSSTQHLTNLVVMPALACVAVAGPVLVPMILGDKWAAAAPLTQIFAFVGLAQVWMSLIGQLLKSLNRPSWLFNWSVFFTFLIGASLWVASRGGIIGVGLGSAAAYLIALPVNYFIIRRLIPISIREIVDTVRGPGLGALVLGACLWVALLIDLASPAVRVSIGIGVGMLGYAAVLWMVDKEFLSDAWRRLEGDRAVSRAPAG